MKKLLLIHFLLFTTFYSHSQQSKIDSLKRVLATLPPEGKSFAGDTIRVRVLCEMALAMPFNQIDSTISFLNNPLRVSQKIQWAFGECISYYWIGYFYVGKNDLMKGIDYLYKGLAIAEKYHFDLYSAKAYKTLGDAYSGLRNYERAKTYLTKSVETFKRLKDTREKLLALNNLGLTYFDKGDYKSSIPHFNQCLFENKKAKIADLDDIFLANLGASQRKMGEYIEALKYFERVENILRNKPNYQYRRTLNLLAIAEVLLLQGNFEKSKNYLIQINKLQKLYGTQVSQKDIYWVYYNLYKKNNNPTLALVYYEKYIASEKKLTQQDQQQQINNLQASFDNERKNTEITILNQNIKQESLLKNIFISGAMLLLLFAVWVWRNSKKLSMQNKIIEHQSGALKSVNQQLEYLNIGLENKVSERTVELQTANEELIKKNEEIILALVEGQTLERKRVASELHDNLGATLSAIKWRLEAINGENLNEKERKIYDSILEMMKGAYSEVRLISHNLLPAELEKGELKAALEKFIADLNSNGKLIINHDIQSEAVPKDKKVQFELYGIALELINNILKHSDAQHAYIALYTKGSQTTFEVSDDGKGLNTQQSSNGMGNKNIQNRVQALNGVFEYLPQKTGLKIMLKFPSSLHTL